MSHNKYNKNTVELILYIVGTITEFDEIGSNN
jgi:hypothetical protein